MRLTLFLTLALASSIHWACDRSSDSRNDPAPVVVTPTDVTPAPAPVTPKPDGLDTPGTLPPADASGLVGGLRLNQSDLFRQLGDGIARQTQSFATVSAKLSQAMDSYCENPVGADRIPVQAAWKDTMLTWEELELYQVGPIEKASIYAWPERINRCRIDAEALAASQGTSDSLPINTDRKGLQAIEYLLFETKLVSSCSETSATTEAWNALAPDARLRARCAYLKPLARDVKTRAESLVKAWGPEGSTYLSGVIGNTVREKAALQSLFENLFYIEMSVKNYKLATPAGHDPMYCPSSPAPCPGKDEFPLSGLSREAIQANLRAFTNLIYGFEDANQKRSGGFAALVRAAGSADVAARSETLTQDLSLIFATQTASLAELIADQKAENCEQSQISILCQLRKSIKQVSKVLKVEYSKSLSLTVPTDLPKDIN